MPSRRILIVEDELITAIDLENRLQRLGYEVSAVAKSGEEAVKLAQDLTPDLVLMDVYLGGDLDGFEASRRINAHKSVPVVYLTAYPSALLKAPTGLQQPGLCIPKPYMDSELRAAIQIALGHS